MNTVSFKTSKPKHDKNCKNDYKLEICKDLHNDEHIKNTYFLPISFIISLSNFDSSISLTLIVCNKKSTLSIYSAYI